MNDTKHDFTWEQFKNTVDEELKKKGIPETVKVWYIDVSWPSLDEEMIISVDNTTGLAIS